MRLFAGLFILASSIFLIHYFFSGEAVYGDGIDYWVHLRSIYFDHDLDFTNEYKHIFSPENNNSNNEIVSPFVLKTSLTSTGKADNPHTGGTASLLWPFFGAADVAILAGLNGIRNGYSDIYQISVGLGSVILGIAGVFVGSLLAIKTGVKRSWARWGAAGIFLGSPLLYYGSYDVINSHTAIFLAVSLFWYILFFSKNKANKRLVFLGALAGLAASIRLQEGLLLIFGIFWLIGNKTERRADISFLMSGFLIVFWPVLYQWKYLYGVWWPQTYLASGHIFRGWTGSLLHGTNGLFSRTPALFLILIKLPQLIVKKREVRYLTLYFLAQMLVITWQGGWRDAAYGARMYISSLPLFTILLAAFLQILTKYMGGKTAILVVLVFALTNLLSIGSFIFKEKEVNSGNKRGLEEHALDRLEKLLGR